MERERRIAKVVRIVAMKDQGNDLEYWQSRPYEERLAALEELRSDCYGYRNKPTPRLQRVYTIVKRS